MAIDVLSGQVLISGRITDAISSTRPRSPATVTVVENDTGERLRALNVRVLSDGYYAVFGDPATMPGPHDIDVRLEVDADGYQATQSVVSFTAAQLGRLEESITVGTESVKVSVIGGLPRVRDVGLTPEPVVLNGRVVASEDPGLVIVGASVEVTSPSPFGPVTTDAQGYFTLGGDPALPVSEVVTLQIQALTRQTLTKDVRLDFRNPFNQGSFALEPV